MQNGWFTENTERLSLVDDSGLDQVDRLLHLRKLEIALMDTPSEIGSFMQDYTPSADTVIFRATSSLLVPYNRQVIDVNHTGKKHPKQYVMFPKLFGNQRLWTPMMPSTEYVLRFSWGQREIDLTVDSYMLPLQNYRNLILSELLKLKESMETLTTVHIRLDSNLRRYASDNDFSYSSPFNYRGIPHLR